MSIHCTVRLKEKRVRENRRLQKVLIPKHALMAIHEIKGVVMSEFDVTGQTSGGLFKASVTVNGTAYDGEGMSKIAAKNAACEKALRDLMLQKLQKKFIQSSLSGSTASMDVDEGDKPSQEDDEDDVPMMTLMSYALHKLFSEWESQGYTIPENKQASPGGDMLLPTIPTRSADSPPPVPPPSAPNLPLPKSELPKNAGTYHPVMLMSIMKPGLKFTDLGCIGTTPNTMYTVSVTIEHVIFLGKGRSKKLAKKAAAKDAMETIYGVKFVDADSMTQ